MGSASTLGPFHARPLRPIVSVPYTIASTGTAEPLQEVPRGSRASASVWGGVAAGGGWPAPIRRTASFATMWRPPKLVNVVTGVPYKPGRAAR